MSFWMMNSSMYYLVFRHHLQAHTSILTVNAPENQHGIQFVVRKFMEESVVLCIDPASDDTCQQLSELENLFSSGRQDALVGATIGRPYFDIISNLQVVQGRLKPAIVGQQLLWHVDLVERKVRVDCRREASGSLCHFESLRVVW